MFSSKYYDVSISSYAWLVKKIAEYDLWTVHSPYGVVVYKDIFMIVKRSKLKIVESQNETIIRDAQAMIKDVDEMFNIYIDIKKIASAYPPILDEIKDILYERVVVDGKKMV